MFDDMPLDEDELNRVDDEAFCTRLRVCRPLEPDEGQLREEAEEQWFQDRIAEHEQEEMYDAMAEEDREEERKRERLAAVGSDGGTWSI